MGRGNPNPSPATRIKKGQVLNPGGRPKALITADTIRALMGKFCQLTKAQLADAIQSPKSTMLEIMVASIIAKAAKDGDYSRFNFLLDRSIGKVKEEIEQTIRAQQLPSPGEAIKILKGDLEE